MNEIVDISKYNPKRNDKFIFDTNIWIYLFYPMGNYNEDITKKYAGFLKKVLQSESSIYIFSLTLSEIFNTSMRLEFNIKKNHLHKNIDFKKDFRNTPEGKKLTSDILMIITHKIMKIATRIDDKFSNIPVNRLFDQIENYDFNDRYFLLMADLDKFKIVTNDSDFAISSEISATILTANEKMLSGG